MCLHAAHRNNVLYESNPQVKLSSSSIGLDTSVFDPTLSVSTCSILDIVYLPLYAFYTLGAVS